MTRIGQSRSKVNGLSRAAPPEGIARIGTALAPLNFKVSKEFRREFKTFASQHDMKMVELLQEGFRLAKVQHARQTRRLGGKNESVSV
jgi:hypothetical protein